MVSPIVQRFLAHASLPQYRFQRRGVVPGEGVAVLVQAQDQVVQRGQQQIIVFEEQLGPHDFVHAGHAGHVEKAAGGETLVLGGEGILDVGAGDDVRQLAGVGDHPVMGLGRAEAHHFEPGFKEERLGQFAGLNVHIRRGAQDHAGVLEQVARA